MHDGYKRKKSCSPRVVILVGKRVASAWCNYSGGDNARQTLQRGQRPGARDGSKQSSSGRLELRGRDRVEIELRAEIEMRARAEIELRAPKSLQRD
ncbi:hypothetical protein MRB53_006280 [Persea americana]|uniref:Uncharacterized protein n=1 Tax=Persea americana TaxID=3435 RepID=A0ACC2MFJ0_PERAE|nr:hypothetical protein MRB53_006280 [Persea americana]